MEYSVEVIEKVDNTIYETYGERWYTAYDDPIALLRAENKTKFPWILEKLKNHKPDPSSILDVGCGGGFLSNELAKRGFDVTGVDLSSESLRVARAFDETGKVKYICADAFNLPFPDNSFDAVSAMDFLEHVEEPEKIIQEMSRVLKPGGLFFFHTFNRNFLSWLVVIKLLEWFIKNTPKNMHILRLFITPKELARYCERANLSVMSMTGIRPVFSTISWQMIKTGIVSKNLRFTLTSNRLLSYMGVAKKKGSLKLPEKIKFF